MPQIGDTALGKIHSLGGNINLPLGHLYCDGSAVSRTLYPGLFSVIGTAWGGGDGSTTFNLPDLRGVFLRGVDLGRGMDPDSTSRSAQGSGGNTGDAVGTYQGHHFYQHIHGVNDPAHAHSVNDPSHNHSVAAGSNEGNNISGIGGNQSGLDSRNGLAGFPALINPATTNIGINGNYTGITLQGNGGNETRPSNSYVFYTIKAY
jgi:microcystin-dependent protein